MFPARDRPRTFATVSTLSTHTYPSNCFVPLVALMSIGQQRFVNNILGTSRPTKIGYPYMLPKAFAVTGNGSAQRISSSCYDICAPRFSNPPAFLMARRISPSVRWSGFNLPSRIIAATSRPCFDINLCKNANLPLEENLGTGA